MKAFKGDATPRWALRTRPRLPWQKIGIILGTVMVFGSISLYLVALGSLEHRARLILRPFWDAGERTQEQGILDPLLFARALYEVTPDRDIAVQIVEPTAPHTHSVVLLHGLYDVAPHPSDIERPGGWAETHPGIRWFFPKSGGCDRLSNGVPGWYNPWIGRHANGDVWDQVAHDFFNESNLDMGDLAGNRRPEDNAQAYSSPQFWEDEFGLIRSARRLWKVLNTQVVGEGPGKVSWDKLIIGGFSQGGFMTLILATTMPVTAAGYLVYSGYLPMRTHPHRLALNPHATIHWVQGTNDELFHRDLVEYSVDVLHGLNYSDVTLTWEQGMGHQFGPHREQTASMNRLMERVWGEGV